MEVKSRIEQDVWPTLVYITKISVDAIKIKLLQDFNLETHKDSCALNSSLRTQRNGVIAVMDLDILRQIVH